MLASKLRALARWERGCDGLRCMATMNKEASISLRMTKPERRELEQTAALLGEAVNPLAAAYVREGVRRNRFPAIEFRDGTPGRIAYLAGSRWPVWMIRQLVDELENDTRAAARRIHRPEPLILMALAYAAAYPAEIRASLELHTHRDFQELHCLCPTLEQL